MFRSPVLDRPIWAAPIAVALGGAVVLAGCGSSSKAAAAPSAAPTSAAAPTTAAPTTAAPTTAAPTTAAAGTTVTATETEFKIALGKQTFTAGSYTFKATNAGTFPHNLVIEGPGVDKKATEFLKPGQSSFLTVTLQAGSYEIWCGVDSHKEKGMDLHITVT